MANRLLKTIIISIIFSALGLAWVVYKLGSIPDIALIKEIKPSYLLLAVLVLLGSFISSSFRMQIFAKQINQSINIFQALRIHILGMFSAAITPSGSGNAPAIAYMLNHHGASHAAAWAAAVATFANDTMFFSWSMPIALVILHFSKLYQTSLTTDILGLVAIAITATISFIFSFKLLWLEPIVSFTLKGPLKRFRNSAVNFISSLVMAHNFFKKAPFSWYLKIQALTAIGWISFFATLYFVATGFNSNINFFVLEAYQSAITTLSFIIPTPGASGFFELGIAPLLKTAGNDKVVAAIILVWRLLSYYSIFILGPIVGGNIIIQKLSKESELKA